MEKRLLELVDILKGGGVAVIPTDTLYGLVARAGDKGAVSRVYKLKGRDERKPFIILTSDTSQLADFSVALDDVSKSFLDKVWPGPVTVILPLLSFAKEDLVYLHRGTKELAFRLPNDPFLRELIQNTGPLVAPSANPEGVESAKTVEEAKKYFGDAVDDYHDGGEKIGEPSSIIRLKNGNIEVVRKGRGDL